MSSRFCSSHTQAAACALVGLVALFSSGCLSTFSSQAPGASLSLSVITVASGSDVAGTTDKVTLSSNDSQGNLIGVGGLSVVFSATGGTSLGQFGATTDNGDGTYTAIFTGAVSGSPLAIGATIDGNAVTSPAPTIVVVPAPMSLAMTTVTVASATDASGTADPVTLTARDALGNQLLTGGLAVAFSNTGGTSTGSLCSTVTDHQNGTYTCGFTGALAGTATTIHATIGGSGVTSAAPTVTVVPGAASLAQSVVTVASPSIVSGTTDLLTLTTKDAAGNLEPAGGLTVVFNNSGGVSTGAYCATVTDNGNGTYSCLFTGVLAGSATSIGATIGGSALTGAAPTIQVTPGPYTLAQSTVAAANLLALVGWTDTVTLTARDAAGNQVSAGGLSVALSVSGGTSAGNLGTVTDNGNGTYSATFTATAAGTPTSISGTIGSSAIGGPPAKIQVLSGTQALSANPESTSTCALSSAGNVYCWGFNGTGQLGNNTTTSAPTPVEVQGVGGVGLSVRRRERLDWRDLCLRADRVGKRLTAGGQQRRYARQQHVYQQLDPGGGGGRGWHRVPFGDRQHRRRSLGGLCPECSGPRLLLGR